MKVGGADMHPMPLVAVAGSPSVSRIILTGDCRRVSASAASKRRYGDARENIRRARFPSSWEGLVPGSRDGCRRDEIGATTPTERSTFREDRQANIPAPSTVGGPNGFITLFSYPHALYQ